MLDRQHYGGPVWDGKGRPKSLMEELKDPNVIFEQGKGEENPNLKKEKEAVFETVKRWLYFYYK